MEAPRRGDGDGASQSLQDTVAGRDLFVFGPGAQVSFARPAGSLVAPAPARVEGGSALSVDVASLDAAAVRVIAHVLLAPEARASLGAQVAVPIAGSTFRVSAHPELLADRAFLNSLRFPLEMIEELEATLHSLEMRQQRPIGQVVDFGPDVRERRAELESSEARLRQALATVVRSIERVGAQP